MLQRFIKAILVLSILTGLARCKEKEEEKVDEKLFHLLAPKQSGIAFSNDLRETETANIFHYQYFYNGGGVAVGDLNNDGLEEIYFSGNMVNNKLYLNKGNLKFQDITLAANVAGRPRSWTTGVSMVDINADGWLDIYVCYSGDLPEENRKNQLFINQGADKQGIPFFKEEAETYGLAESAYSTSAAFFDLDGDLDLDAVLLNHNPKLFRNLDEISFNHLLNQNEPLFSTKLMENQEGKFVDVSKEMGWDTSPLSYGLGLSIADFNNDDKPDIFVGNDYSAPDHLYVQTDGKGFQDRLKESFGHTSLYSMGSDAADINNDGWVDLISLDMLPESNERQKLLFSPDNYEHFNLFLKVGLHYQYMRNMLQLNNGDGTFSEIGQLAGVSNTDWSWAPLWADFDQDGWKDLFVSNGFVRDFTNLDFIKYRSSFFEGGELSKTGVLDLIKEMPSSEVDNYIFRNNQDLTFKKSGQSWGIDHHSNSNGAAYTDLDNDGDLDLVISNVNQVAFIYENLRNEFPEHHWLQVALKGGEANLNGIGAKVYLYQRGEQQMLEQMPYRGYQSSVSPVLTFGLLSSEIDSVKVVWPSSRSQVLISPKSNQRVVILEGESESASRVKQINDQEWVKSDTELNHLHQDKLFNDFKRQPLLPYPLSNNGPVMAKADVNNDKVDDVFIGSGLGQPGYIYFGNKNRGYNKGSSMEFSEMVSAVQTNAVFCDIDNDGDQDLFIRNGGYHDFLADDERLKDQLYLNDGKGGFINNPNAVPELYENGKAAVFIDVNEDGFQDVFLGGGAIPGRFPEFYPSRILVYDGKGSYSDQTDKIGLEIRELGLVSDAVAYDIDRDGKEELIVLGEWMAIKVFGVEEGKMVDLSSHYFDRDFKGIWNTLEVGDFDGDGNPELLAGNWGLNSQLKVSEKEPAELIYKDFDGNGAVDPILSLYFEGKMFPYVSRDELLEQISNKRTSFESYASYAQAKVVDIFSSGELSGAKKMKVNTMETMLFELEEGKFIPQKLPIEVQFAPIFSITLIPSTESDKKEIWLGGNLHQTRIKIGNIDANYGLIIRQDDKGTYRSISPRVTGFQINGDVRSSLWIGEELWVGQFNGEVGHYKRK
ncbi:VCBS repeat-containing protein [Echinicola sp. CAU 1574]|uniref:VCBS repeat-containing protein n=1 Tax=Echinicola arenosa TaxID=2774144 RepID=A0ABR9ASH8_9BACT|nr:VCBS repeat-containing protein [Echinicola arenosa]MBD8490833.1 VCBS repeat-containing protein [Echinicola arenosa]